MFIFMFIANNYIFKSIMQYFLTRSIALKGCYLMMNFEKNYFTVFKISEKYNLIVKALQNVIFDRSITQILYVLLVVIKPYTKFQQLLFSKTAILLLLKF